MGLPIDNELFADKDTLKDGGDRIEKRTHHRVDEILWDKKKMGRNYETYKMGN